MTIKEATKRYDLPETEYGGRLERAMLENGISIRDLSEATSISYEHVRKLVRGERLPTALANRAICAILDLDEDEMTKAKLRDQHVAEYGCPLPDDCGKEDPLLTAITNGWPLLTVKQREVVSEHIANFLFQNRAHGVFRKQ